MRRRIRAVWVRRGRGRVVWNGKSALMSACCRAPIFFVANLPAGGAAAASAFLVEFVYRVVAAGFYGALTEYFARLPNARLATPAALVVLPAVAHGVEYLVHWSAGTPRIGTAIAVSVGVSVATTRLSLFVMRRGLFVSRSRQSFAADVTALGRLTMRAFTR